jgi:xyloglucan-specific endo-beta-1,4-glucanase
MQSVTLSTWRKAALLLTLAVVGCNESETPVPGGSGGSSTGGSGTSGGTSTTGGSNSGGANSGGTSGSSSGGASSGGANSGGTGGSNSGGAPITGGSNSGGAPITGGSSGANTGGTNTGGVNTGGSSGATGGGSDACGGTCKSGQVCVSGVCQCDTGYTLCGGVCLSSTDILTNPQHCGTTGCGVACPSTATCVSGACQCPSGQTACGTICADLNSDVNNCGKCGTVCASKVCNPPGDGGPAACRPVKDCTTKVTAGLPMIADFEAYDGTTAAASWGWAFGAPAGSGDEAYAGLYNSNDGTGSPVLAIVGPGYNASKFTAKISNTLSSGWGGQLGMWMGCVDASAYQGISFWVQGAVPGNQATMALTTAATSPPDSSGYGGGSCVVAADAGTCSGPSVTFPVTSTWAQVLIPWATFTPGKAGATNITTTGSDITGMSWNVGLVWAANDAGGYSPTPAAYNLSVDDVQFIGATACTGGLTLCGTGCVNTASNNVHCGRCDNACASPRTCSSGTCTCPSGYTDCSGQCVDTRIDAQNCGGCGKPCTGVCTAGACQASSCTANMTQLNKTSTAYASIILGKYWINNNVWGASGATGTQSIWSTCNSGNTIGWGTDWTWTGSASQVKSYASSVLGWHWGWKVSGTGLPVQLSANRTITCGWTYRVNSGQTIDVAYDLFAHTLSNPGTNDDPTDEIMIWLYRSGGAAPIGGTSATVSIAGTSWELHEGSNGRWQVHSYVRASNAATGATLNISDFLRDLTTNRGFSSSKYLSSIQAGTEVFLGTGRLDTDQYYCTIQ